MKYEHNDEKRSVALLAQMRMEEGNKHEQQRNKRVLQKAL